MASGKSLLASVAMRSHTARIPALRHTSMLSVKLSANACGLVAELFVWGSSMTTLPYRSVWCSSVAPSTAGSCHQPAGRPTLSRGSALSPGAPGDDDVIVRLRREWRQGRSPSRRDAKCRIVWTGMSLGRIARVKSGVSAASSKSKSAFPIVRCPDGNRVTKKKRERSSLTVSFGSTEC